MSDSVNSFLAAQSQYPSQSDVPVQDSYAGDRRDVDPNASVDANGKQKPFYRRQDFYDNLLNFGASTLAANAEPGMNAFGAIGRGVLGAVEANRNEREAQASIRGQNAQQGLERENARYRGQEIGLSQRRLDMIDHFLNGNGDSGSDSGMQGPLSQAQPTQQNATDVQQQARLPEAPLLTGLAHVESGGDPSKINAQGYGGLYGLGTAALQTAGVYTPSSGENVNKNQWTGTINVPGYSPMTHQQFMQNPGAQTAAMHQVLHSNAQALQQNGAVNYVGKTMPDGTQITLPSLLAGAHIAGPTGMLHYLQTGQSSTDANGTSIPQYINSVNSAMQHPQTADVVHDAQAQAGHDMLGGQDAMAAHVQRLKRQIAVGKMIGIGTGGYEAELNNIYALQKAGYQADLDRQTHAANTDYDVNNKPMATRSGIAMPVRDENGTLTGYRYIKEPQATENFDPQTGMQQHGFVESGANGSTYFQPTQGVQSEGRGLEGEDEETARISGKLREESVQKMDAAKQNLSTLQSYQDNLGNINTGPGESYLVGLKRNAMAAMRATGMTVSPDMEKSITSAQNVSSLAGALNAHMFSSVHNVKNTVEFKSLQSAIPGIDNTPESLQFILAHGQGESLEDMAESSFLQGPAQNPQKFPQFYKRGVFDANKALATFHQNVSPMSYTYMLLNSSPTGRNMISQMVTGDRKAIGSRLTAAQKSLAWMRDNGVLFNAQGNQD